MQHVSSALQSWVIGHFKNTNAIPGNANSIVKHVIIINIPQHHLVISVCALLKHEVCQAGVELECLSIQSNHYNTILTHRQWLATVLLSSK